jgi:hypothetical protein
VADKPKRITFRSPELQALGKELAKQGEQKRKQLDKDRSNRSFAYWPSSKNYVVWTSSHDDHDEFYLGIEMWCQYLFDLRPDVMPLRPKNGPTHLARYKFFYILSKRYNAGDFAVEFVEID